MSSQEPIDNSGPEHEQILADLRKLHGWFMDGTIPGAREHEAHPDLDKGSRENYLYFTLPCCINFQRSSPAMWQSAYDTYIDEDTRFLYDPELVHNATLAQVQTAMLKHKLASQTNKHPQIWKAICETLYTYYDSDPRSIVLEGESSIKRIAEILQKEKKDIFPFLGGIKLSNYWMFILTRFTDVQFVDPYELSIIPDTHIIQCTVQLGLAQAGVSAEKVEQIWRPILKELEIPARQMHPTLWLWSRNNFNPPLHGTLFDS